MSENGSLNPVEQNDLLQQITLALTHSLPPGWGECTVVHRSLGSHSETLGQVSMVTGPGLPAPFDVPAALGELFERLRAGMHTPGLGTWFTATFTLTFPFSYDVRYDRDGEPRWQSPPPPDAAAEEQRRFPRDAEHTPAWLDAGSGQEMRVARPFDGTAPDGRPEVRRPDVPGGEREAMVRYLERAPIVLAARSYDSDVLDPEQARNVPLTYHTDGTWIWPGAVGYYLRAHGVPPEPELAEHIRRGGFEVPDVADDVRSAAVATITGSS
ncbi:hypothetical protein [Actinomadura madurae]|uniref:hypothetical protein n=1 Tax=Actinomadura madurae TaxID=1993 RepID=UPI0020D25DB2|nr:hypothetical protein [Actinomadura madurae]MCP9950817.1 hypothetical protein [Actinomadura madurae]MCP9967596.1 hypothetical protein [Actinomadura madurae]MCP9980046.1 hypothetical protein [Actinomadura madurae]MCQ0016262.1 hypothetical protein [Actinomadura madurae]